MIKRTLHRLCIFLFICLGLTQIGYANANNDTPRTYSIHIQKLTTDFKNILLEDLPQMDIKGFQQVKESGHYLVKVSFNEGLAEDQPKQKKTSAGHPYMQVSYRAPIYTLNVLTEKGKVLFKKKYGGEKETMDWGKERKFNDAAQLKVSWRQAVKTLWKEKEINSIDLKMLEKDLQAFFKTITPSSLSTAPITKTEETKKTKTVPQKTEKIEALTTKVEKNDEKSVKTTQVRSKTVPTTKESNTDKNLSTNTPKKTKVLDPFATQSEIDKSQKKNKNEEVAVVEKKTTITNLKKEIPTSQNDVKIAKVASPAVSTDISERTTEIPKKEVEKKADIKVVEKPQGTLTKNIKTDKSSLLEIANKYPMSKYNMSRAYGMKAGKKFPHHKTKAKSNARKNNFRASAIHALTALTLAEKKGQIKKSTELVNENYPKAVSSSIKELEKNKAEALVFKGDVSAFSQNRVVNIYYELDALSEVYAKLPAEKTTGLYKDEHDYKTLLEEAIKDREAVCTLLSKSHLTKAEEDALIAKSRKDYLAIARRIQHANYFHKTDETVTALSKYKPMAQMRLGYAGMLNYTKNQYPVEKFVNALLSAVKTKLNKKNLPYFQKDLNPSIAGANTELLVSIERISYLTDKTVSEPQKREKTVKKVKVYATYTRHTQEATARYYGSYLMRDIEAGEILMEGSISDVYSWSHDWGRATGNRLALSKSDLRSLERGPVSYPTITYMKDGTASDFAYRVSEKVLGLANKHGTYSGKWTKELTKQATHLRDANYTKSQQAPIAQEGSSTQANTGGSPTLGQMVDQYQTQMAAVGVASNFNTSSAPQAGFDNANANTNSYSSGSTVYGAAAEERLNEKIDFKSHTADLHQLIKQKAEKLNRFDLIMTEDVDKMIAGEASQRKKVVLLPLLYQGKTDLSAYDSYFKQAKEKGIDQFMLVNIQTMTAFPVSERNINVSNTFVGFEGKVSYKIDYYDAQTRKLLHSVKIADSNVGNAGGAKVLADGVGLLLGANRRERGEMKDLVNAVQEKTKKAALTKAFNQSSKKLDKHWETQFPLYFDITNVALDAKGKNLLFSVNGGQEIGLVNAQILSIVQLAEDGKETEFTTVFIKELLPTESKCQANKKIAESLKAAFENGAKLKAKVDVRKVNALQSGLQGGKKLFGN